MTKEQIRESNESIAMFMGFLKAKPQKFRFAGLFGKKEAAYQKNVGHWKPYFSIDFFKYHSSWDWLMPVIEKISKIQVDWENASISDTYYPRTFGMLNPENGRPMVRMNAHPLHEADTLIEATYLAVVDFIKSYQPINITTNG